MFCSEEGGTSSLSGTIENTSELDGTESGLGELIISSSDLIYRPNKR